MINDITSKRIQVLRGLAIIAVVIIHSNANGIISVIDRPFVNFAVAIFIFISGYLTKLSYSDIRNFYKKRIVKVGMPYIVWTIIYTIANNKMEVIFLYLISGGGATPFYFVIVYIQLVLITPIINKLILSNYRWIGWLITPIYILIIRYICPTLGIKLGFPFPNTIFLGWFIYYYLGIALGNNKINYDISTKVTVFFYLITIILSIGEGLCWYRINNFDMATTQLKITSILTSV